jgi:hypothetical protein
VILGIAVPNMVRSYQVDLSVRPAEGAGHMTYQGYKEHSQIDADHDKSNLLDVRGEVLFFLCILSCGGRSRLLQVDYGWISEVITV